MKYSKTYLNDMEQITNVICNLDVIKNTKILITGSTGLICSAIVDYLMYLNKNRNYNISIYVAARSKEKVLNRFSTYTNDEHFIFTQYNSLEDIQFEYDFDYVIFGAGIANPSEYVNNPVETMNTSYIGLNNILRYGLKHKYKKIVYVSTCEIYGINDSSTLLNEKDYGYIDYDNLRASYPASRRACEVLCHSYYKEYEINYSIARPGHIYGPTMSESDNRVASYFLKCASKKENIILKSSGEQVRSFCYVLDAVSAILTILINGKNGEAYNISNHNANISIRDLANHVSSLSNIKVVYDNPKENEKKCFNPMNNSMLDNLKLLNLGWKPLFDIECGILHSLKEFNIQ